MSLKTNGIPNLWKGSTICPVPKKRNPAVLNDYRPVALTPIIMKVLVMLQRLMEQTGDHMDAYQFAYRQIRGLKMRSSRYFMTPTCTLKALTHL